MRTRYGRSLTHGLVDRIGHEIVTGAYSPGNPFPTEAALCQRFGASRSVLREAVKMLTAKGMLRARPRQGTWVDAEQNWNLLDPDILRWLLERTPSLALLSEFSEVRLAVEPEAAALAAQRGEPAAVREIFAALERMRRAELGLDDPLASDIAFHVAILQASKNRFYAQLRDVIDAALRISIELTNARKGVRLASVEEHAGIAEAIAARDAETARRRARALILEVITLIEAARGQAPPSGAASGPGSPAAPKRPPPAERP